MTPAEKLNSAIDFVAHSREELKKGQVVVLEGFQHDVKKICEEIAQLPQAEKIKFTPTLNELSKQLKVLEAELRNQQHGVQQEIFSLNRKHKALKSYQTVSHSHKIPDKKDEQ